MHIEDIDLITLLSHVEGIGYDAERMEPHSPLYVREAWVNYMLDGAPFLDGDANVIYGQGATRYTVEASGVLVMTVAVLDPKVWSAEDIRGKIQRAERVGIQVGGI